MLQGTPLVILVAVGSLATGLLCLAVWTAGQRLSDRTLHRRDLPAGGWWMGLSLILPAWTWVTVFAAQDRADLAVGQLLGGQMFRLLVAMPLVMMVVPVTLERSGSRWLLMATAIFGPLSLVCGIDGWIGGLDAHILLTITAIIFWVVVEDDSSGLRMAARTRRFEGASAVARYLVPAALMLALLPVAVLTALGISGMWVPAWFDRPIAVSAIAIAAAWPAVPAALLMRRWWGAESAVRGLLLANVLAPGLAFIPIVMTGEVRFSLPLWRVDTWMMVLAALLPMPLLMRDGRFGRVEAAVLLGVYALYLSASWALPV